VPHTQHATSGKGGHRSQIAGFFFFFITLGLEMSDTKVYEPRISHLCEAVVPKSRIVPIENRQAPQPDSRP
jgi:hypothetical protein